MYCHMLLSFILLFHSVYGQGTNKNENHKTSVIGPDSFITDGTRDLNLTCQTHLSSSLFDWVLDGRKICQNRPASALNVCIFQPRISDDGENVTCVVQDSNLDALSRATYTLNLIYPPQSSPNITLSSHTTQPLKQGDVIRCSVSGGKPRVTNVTFNCRNPDLADHKDDVSDDGGDISSVVMVDTSQATEQNMTCTCSATWNPEPELYPNASTARFQLEYKAKVANFSVNGTQKLTVNDKDHATVVFACDGVGRPSPVLRLYKQGNRTAIAEKDNRTDIEQPISTFNTRCTDMGNYSCEADNGFPDPDSKTVRLVVNCAPERLNSDQMKVDPPVVTSQGHTFAMVAYPTPQVQAIYFLGNSTHSVQRNIAHKEDLRADFRTECNADKALEYLVQCSVTPHRIPESRLGYYNLSVSNDFGTLNLTFRVTSAVTQQTDSSAPSTAVLIGVIVGSVLGVVVIGVIVVCVIKHRRTRNAHRQSRETLDLDERKRDSALPCSGPFQHKGSAHTTHLSPNTNNNSNNSTIPVSEDCKYTTGEQARPSFNGIQPYAEIKDVLRPTFTPLTSEGGYATVGEQMLPVTPRISTDASGYASVGDNVINNTIAMSGHHDNRAGNAGEQMELSPYDSTDCNMQEAQGISSTHVEPTSEREPDMSTRPEDSNPGSNASRASMERVTGPKGDEYAVVSPKLNRAN